MDPDREYVPTEIEESTKEAESTSDEEAEKLLGSLKDFSVELSGGGKRSSSHEASRRSQYRVEQRDKVYFPSLMDALSTLLELANIHLYILIDEWSSIPLDLQPYLAELLSRTLLPLKRTTLKIAALEYRSVFLTYVGFQPVGFELGPDIVPARNLDDYYTFEINESELVRAFADVVYKHLQVELGSDYFQKRNLLSGESFAAHLTASLGDFAEIVEASAGNLRDFLQLFADAFDADYTKKARHIRLTTIRQIAREHSKTRKLSTVPFAMRDVLAGMVKVVVDDGNSGRCCLLPEELVRHKVIQQLLDLRILHVTERGYTSRDRVGEYFTRLAVDHGLLLPYLSDDDLSQHRAHKHRPYSRTDDIMRMMLEVELRSR